MYQYRATLVRAIDGDTAVLDIDLGLHVHTTRIVRLLGIDAPEILGTSKEKGEASKYALASLLSHGPLRITTHLDKNDKYGRVLGEIETVEGVDVADAMVDGGYAVYR